MRLPFECANLKEDFAPLFPAPLHELGCLVSSSALRLGYRPQLLVSQSFGCGLN